LGVWKDLPSKGKVDPPGRRAEGDAVG
jgi:hypothetical protein